MGNEKIFGMRLKELRLEYNLSQEGLANKLNSVNDTDLNKSLISRYENGIHSPKFTLIQQMADFFQVTTDYLMGLSSSRYSGSVIELDLKKIPVVGLARAGVPIYMLEEFGEYEYTDNKRVDFAVRVTGNSMIGARICEGDIALIVKQPDVDNGDIALVAVDDDSATIKRVYKEKGKIILKSENSSMKDMVFVKSERERLRIIGKVVEVKFKV